MVGFDPSIISQIGRFLIRLLLVKLSRSVRSPFVGFVSVVNKSYGIILLYFEKDPCFARLLIS